MLLLEGSDEFVIIADTPKIARRDHVVDIPEGLVAGALIDLAEDRVGRRAAVHQQDIGGRLDADPTEAVAWALSLVIGAGDRPSCVSW